MIGKYYYNLYKKYYAIKRLYSIKLYHVFKYRYVEFINDPLMYIKRDFLPYNQIVFDVGSQFGDYALLWEKHYNANVYAFELLKSNYNVLLNNIRINKSHIHANNMAIGNSNILDYYIKGNMANQTYVAYNKNHTYSYSIDDIAKEYNAIPDMLKIDVEGFEYDVLWGSINILRQFHPKIILEVHTSELFDKCNNFLLSLNYELKYTDNIRSNGWMDYVANLYYL